MLTRWTRCTLLIVTVSVSLSPLTAPSHVRAGESAETVFAQIRNVWAERQHRFDSGVIRWTQTEFYLPGAVHYADGSQNNSRITQHVNCRFAFDGRRAAYRSEGQEWDHERLRFDHSIFKATVDGSDVRILFDGEMVGKYSSCFLCTQTVMTEGTDENREAAIVSFRPLSKNLSWYTDLQKNWTVTAHDELVRGHPCLRLERGGPAGRMVVWLDSKRDYLPVRRAFFVENDKLHSLDLEYVKHAEYGWIPSTWSWLSHDPDTYRLEEGFSATVTEASFNHPIPDEELEIAFRPRMKVTNQRNGEFGIIREDGSFRLIDREELVMGKTYEELLLTEAPSVLHQRRVRSLWLCAILGVVLLSVLFVWTQRVKVKA